MSAAHTPGPWRSDFLGYESHTHYVRTEWKGRGGPAIHGSAGAIAKIPASKFHNGEANARLIAAAPDLLAACIALLANAEAGLTNLGAMRAARAAIRKATGSES